MAILGTTFPWCVRLSSIIPGFVSVDLIGENNQVILEWQFTPDMKHPREDAGGSGSEYISVSAACPKRRLIWAVCRNHRIKGWSRVGVGRTR